MTQLALNIPGGFCGEIYVFSAKWRRIFDEIGTDSAPLFCAELRGHDGRHVDKRTGIPWDAWRGE